jgi:hypothetical protein
MGEERMTEAKKPVAAAKALVACLAELANPPKDGFNPHFKKHYLSLPALLDFARPVLAKHGLCAVQAVVSEEDRAGVITRLIHESGHEWTLGPVYLKDRATTAQGAASAISYARRYSLMAALGVAGEDDDGNTASQEPRQPVATEDDVVAALADIESTQTKQELVTVMQKVSALTFAPKDKEAIGAKFRAQKERVRGD